MKGPLIQCVEWCRTNNVWIIHIRDWHNEHRDRDHLLHFGKHAMENTAGANLVCGAPTSEKERFVNAVSLNDLADTTLKKVLFEEIGADPETSRVAIVG